MTRALAYRTGSALVRRAAMRHPTYRYARTAYKYGPTAVKYGSKIARFMYRRYKKRKQSPAKKARMGIGENLGTSNAKQEIQLRDTIFVARSSRTLYIENITGTDQGTANNRTERQMSVINCRGFRICMAVRNQLNQPLYFNMAIVSPKNSGQITTANFFRGQGNNSRGLAFDNSRTSLEFHCLPLNTDNKYILKHKRYRLNPDSPTTQTQYDQESGSSYKNIDWYVKLKRQLRYQDADANFPIDGSVYLVHWFDLWSATAGSAEVPNCATNMQRNIMYYRETKVC